MLSPNGCNNMTFVVFRVLYLFSRYGSVDEGRLAIGEMGGFSCRRSKKISSWSYIIVERTACMQPKKATLALATYLTPFPLATYKIRR